MKENATYFLFFFLLLSIFVRYLKLALGDVVYVVVLLPILTFILLSFFEPKKMHFHKFDLILLYCLVLLFFNLFMTGVRGGLQSQAIFIIYIFIPALLYFSVRKVDISKELFCRFLVLFSLVFAITTISEFLLYKFSPASREVITLYFKNVVQNNNFNPPHVNYPLIGYHTKPWGPMFDASGNGAFLSVLACFVYERYKSHKSMRLFCCVCILFVSVFVSGSKSAYVMVLLYFFAINFMLFFTKPTFSTTVLFIFSPFLFAAVVTFFVSFFFSPELLGFYIEALFIKPLYNLYDGIVFHNFSLFFGLGQETNINIIIGTGEIDLINSLFRYGFIFTLMTASLLIILSLKAFKSSPEFSALFFMSTLAMNHYQVSFKFPASIILFMAIATFMNNEKSKKNNCNKVLS